MRLKLQSDIKGNAHRLDLLEQHCEDEVDKHVLAFNGLRELTDHVRERSTDKETKLNDRLVDVECYLEKTTAFQRRRS